jgi:hypothetical protein
VQYVAPHAGDRLDASGHGRRRETETHRHTRLIMTISGNLSSTPFSSLASTSASEKPATASKPGGIAQPQEGATAERPSLPTGLVGHHVNTTA